MKRCSMKRKSITSQALEICWATRGQGRTHGDQRTWWRGLRIADRRKTSTFRLLVQVYRFARLPGSSVAARADKKSIHSSRLCIGYRSNHRLTPDQRFVVNYLSCSLAAQARKYSKNRFTKGLSSLASRCIRGQNSANPTCLRSFAYSRNSCNI